MANAPGFDPNDLSKAELGGAGQRRPPGRLRARLHRQGHVDGRRAGGERRHARAPMSSCPTGCTAATGSSRTTSTTPTWYLTLNGVLAKSSNIGTILATGQLGKTQAAGQPGPLLVPAQVRHRQPHRARLPRRDHGHPRQARRTGRPRSSTRSPSARASPSTPCRPPPSTRRSPTAASASSPPWSAAPRAPTAASPRPPQPEKTRVVSAKTAKTLAADAGVGRRTTRRAPAPRRASPATGSAGKTGTANRVDPATGRYHGYTASFAGFAPADKPRITVYCAIQNPTKGSYFGGQICGPIYKQVMEFALKTLQVPPTGAKAPRLPVTFTPGQCRRALISTGRPAHQEPPRDDDHPRPREPTAQPPPAPSLRPGPGAPGTLTAVPHADQSQTTQKGAPVTYPGAAPAGPGLRHTPRGARRPAGCSQQPGSAARGHRHHPRLARGPPRRPVRRPARRPPARRRLRRPGRRPRRGRRPDRPDGRRARRRDRPAGPGRRRPARAGWASWPPRSTASPGRGPAPDRHHRHLRQDHHRVPRRGRPARRPGRAPA